jgi:16S rRNA (cytosine1402-N4)-methyltransferase
MREHIPVMVTEVLHFLDPKPGEHYIDATVGAGGHLSAILQKGGEVLGIDQDPKAIKIARRRLKACPGVFKLVQGNFSKIDEIAAQQSWQPVSGIVFDLGFASFQVDDPKYGLSFAKEAPLDMRLNPEAGVKAADLVNGLSAKELARLFFTVGEEKLARPIARAIVTEREKGQITTTKQVARLVEDVYKARGLYRKTKIHPATKVFMSLRVAVNSEFENLRLGLEKAVRMLQPGGRIVVISFHSGEDRIVKHFFKEMEAKGLLKNLTKKPIRPSKKEVKENRRARSARLRAAEKL